MSYAQRPMGDYKTYGYAGDPGWLSSLWRGIKKVAAPIVGGMLGGPIGAAVGGAVFNGGGTPPIRAAQPGTIGGAISFPGGVSISTAYQRQAVVPYKYPRAIAGQQRRPQPGVPAGMAMDACPSGYHLDKLTGTKCVRNRRMNVANPRALRRSMRRVQGFEKLAKRTIQFTRRVRMKKRKSS